MAIRNDRTIREKQPVTLIAMLVLGGVLLLSVIFFATWRSGQDLADARMRGVVVKKTFTAAPEEQITIGPNGVQTGSRDGEYRLTVRVTPDGGESEDYEVWLDKTRYDAVAIGDSFDVGPYLVKGD